MNTPNTDHNKTKICVVCKVRKPLADFIVTDISHGSKKYSDICNACRLKAGNQWKKNLFINDDEEADEGGGGKINRETIDSNIKDHLKKQDKKKKEQFEEDKEEAREEFNEEERKAAAEKELAAYILHKRKQQRLMREHEKFFGKRKRSQSDKDSKKDLKKAALGLGASSKAYTALAREQQKLATIKHQGIPTKATSPAQLFKQAEANQTNPAAKRTLKYKDVDPTLRGSHTLESIQAKNRQMNVRILNERTILGGFRSEQKRLRFGTSKNQKDAPVENIQNTIKILKGR